MVVAGLLVLGLVLASFAVWFRTRAESGTGISRTREIPGDADRVVVEVLNATGNAGLARVATGRLRDAGFDVVYYASDTSRTLDSTQVLVRRGEARNAELVREALGVGLVGSAPDPGRLVDVTVRIGADFLPLARDP
jgi:hypothetical protein